MEDGRLGSTRPSNWPRTTGPVPTAGASSTEMSCSPCSKVTDATTARPTVILNPRPLSRCGTCGRKRPTYAVFTEDDEIIYLCGECIALRSVKDD